MHKEKLSNILNALESGGRPKGGATLDVDGIPSLGAEHLNDIGGFNFTKLKFVPNIFFNNLRKGLIEINDILIVKDGATTGKVSFVSTEFPFNKAAVNEHVFLLKIAKRKAYPGYVFHYLFCKQGQKEIMKDFRGATVGGISRKFADLVKVPLPSLPDQIRIATVLSKAEALIAQRKESLRLLDELLRSTFLEMFGDPVRNEKGWAKKNLGDVTSLITDGKHGDSLNEENSGYYFISAKDIHDGIIDYSNARQITKKDFEEVHRRTNLCSGNLVVVNTGATIGKLAIATMDDRTTKTTFQKSVAIIKPKKDILISIYLKFLFALRLKDLVKSSSGSAQQNLLLSQMRKIVITLPPLPLQTQFAQIVEKVEALKARYQASLKELENLYASLSQRAFKGELDLSKMDVQVPEEKLKEKVFSLR